MEAVLLIGLMSIVGLAIRDKLTASKPFEKMIAGRQWDKFQGMAQYGVVLDLQNGGQFSSLKTKHPNYVKRYLSTETQ